MIATLIIVIALALARLGKDHTLLKQYIPFSLLVYIYYAVAGKWYWFEYQPGYHLGVNWQDWSETVSLYYHGAYALMTTCVVIACSKHDTATTDWDTTIGEATTDILKPLIGLGTVAAIYVLIKGKSIIASEALLTSDPVILIATQVSDILIPVTLFMSTSERHRIAWRALAIFFLYYAATVGFRYKIVLLITPLIFSYLLNPATTKSKKALTIIIATIGILGLSAMTLARKKFEGIDLDALSDINIDDLAYAIFAEANISFGLATIIANFGEHIPFAGIQPLIDAITQWVPRFISPSKNVNLHLNDIAWSLGASQEALNAGTSQPFFGEYYAMGGLTATVIGIIIAAIVLSKCWNSICKNATSKHLATIGSGLLVAFFAYYYYSRGSIAQISKGFIFIILPYLWILNIQKHNCGRHA